MTADDRPSNDDDLPDGGTASDMWARLQALEGMPKQQPQSHQPQSHQPQSHQPQSPARPQQPQVDHTQVVPPTQAPGAPAPGGPGGQRQYYVPSGGGTPPAAQQAARAPQAQRAAQAQQAARQAYQQHAPAGPPSNTPPTGPQPQPGPSPEPQPTSKPARRRKRWYRPKLRWFFLYLPLLIMASIAALGFWGWRTVQDLGRVDVGDSLTAASGDSLNYLIVGSDTREGAELEGESGYVGTSDQVAGQRADTIIVLRVEPERSIMMSIPRDLWATNVATGKKGRINGTYNQGPDNLIRSVTANLGIPIHHYVEVDFVSFGAMVDAMGGVDIEFPHAVFDRGSGLNIIAPGVQTLDGQQALAYVRARNYTEIIDGNEVKEPTADLGRQQRQQLFIRTVLKTAGAERNPLTLARIAGGAAKGVKVDQVVGFSDLLGLARKLGAGDPETRILPTANANIGGAAVLELRNSEALPILAEFGAG